MNEEMSLAELAEAAGIPGRSIRFYIARGILAGPLRAGRGAVYGPEHLKRLEQIRKLQAEGRMLSEIAGLLEEKPSESTLAPPTAWWQHQIADDVVVLTRSDAAPWRVHQIRAALEELTKRLERKE